MFYLYHYKHGLVAESRNVDEFSGIMDDLGGCFSVSDHKLTNDELSRMFDVA